MRPLRALPALACLALAAAPVPKDRGGPAIYFSVREGDKWVYELTSGDRTSEVTETVSKVAAKDGCVWVTVVRQAQKHTTTVYEVSAKGVARVAANDHELADPHTLLKMPARGGETWTVKGDPAGVPDTVYTAGKEIEVEVPAGKFRAIAVEGKRAGQNGRGSVRTTWYAPNLGVVKMVYKVGDAEQTTVLKSFKPGK